AVASLPLGGATVQVGGAAADPGIPGRGPATVGLLTNSTETISGNVTASGAAGVGDVTLDVVGGAGAPATPNTLLVSGVIGGTGVATIDDADAAGATTIQDNILLDNGGVIANTVLAVDNAAATLLVNGVISDAPAGNGFTKSGPGALTLTAVNTYDGNTDV